LRSEIDSLPQSDYLSDAQLSKQDKFQAFLKEALRIHPPFVGPFERVVAPGGETAIPNVKPIPVGTRVWSDLYVMCRSKQVFGDDVDIFRPERWLSSPPEQLKNMDDLYCVFGRGSRSCIGKDLAWRILEKTIAAVSPYSFQAELSFANARGSF
jgi:cytochrome P450